MKISIVLLICFVVQTSSQNITNTLGSSGLFTIKDGSTSYLTISQSTGQVNILKTLRLENTTNLKAENDELKAKLAKFEEMQNLFVKKLEQLESKDRDVKEIKIGEK